MNGTGIYLSNDLVYNLSEKQMNSEIFASSQAGTGSNGRRLKSLDDAFRIVFRRFPDECLGFVLATLNPELQVDDSIRVMSPVFYTGVDYSHSNKTSSANKLAAFDRLVKNQNNALGAQIGKKVVMYSMREVGPSFANDLLIAKTAFQQFGISYSPRDDLVRNFALYLLREELIVGYDVQSSYYYPIAGKLKGVVNSAFELCDKMKSTISSADEAGTDSMGKLRVAQWLSHLLLAQKKSRND